MSSVKKSISEAMDRVKKANKNQLEFLLNFRDGNSGRHVMSRAEKWLQMELLYQLHCISVKERDVFVEYPIEYRTVSNLRPRRLENAKKGFIDIAYKPKDATNDVYVGIELKFKKNPTSAHRESLKDILKLAAMRKPGHDFRAFYVLTVYDKNAVNVDKSNYLKFIDSNDIHEFGGFCYSLVGHEVPPASKDGFLISFRDWTVNLKKKAQEYGLTME